MVTFVLDVEANSALEPVARFDIASIGLGISSSAANEKKGGHL